MSNLIDPTQIISTFIALLPVDLCIFILVLSLNRKVRAMWAWYQMFPTLNGLQIRFAKWWLEHSLEKAMETERDVYLEMHDGGTPPWEAA